MKFANKMVDKLIERSLDTPYSHLFHGDGSPYMRRYWVMPRGMLRPLALAGYELRPDVRWLPACRLHNICTPDFDREMHNHPWSFISIVLRGGYTEAHPTFKEYEPVVWQKHGEPCYTVERGVGSIAYRAHSERHKIIAVKPDTWTLILQGPKQQSWGFFTETGFVPWREFESVHQEAIATERARKK